MNKIIETKIPGFKILQAEKKDIKLIKDLIYELAVYEKLSHQAIASESDLETYLFSEKKVAEVLLGYFNEKPVGFALFFQNFSTFLGKPGIYLEDIFIREEFRGRGFGKALLIQIAKIAMERDCGRMEWAVLDWNKPSIDFYKSLGAKVMDEWLINRLTGDALKKLADLN